MWVPCDLLIDHAKGSMLSKRLITCWFRSEGCRTDSTSCYARSNLQVIDLDRHISCCLCLYLNWEVTTFPRIRGVRSGTYGNTCTSQPELIVGRTGVSMSKPGTASFAVLVTILASLSLEADYFDDQGNMWGKFRTDYASKTEGSAENPLEIDTDGCYFEPSELDTVDLIYVHPTLACPHEPTVYPGGPFYYANVGSSDTSFWVLSANVEIYAFSNASPYAPLGNQQGPPNLSTSLTTSPHLLKFLMRQKTLVHPQILPGFEAHLMIDNEGEDGEEKFPYAIPFLGVGAHKGWGNNGFVGHMNLAGAPHATTWTSLLRLASTSNVDDVVTHNVVAVAKWGGIQRMIQLVLFHDNIETSNDEVAGLHRHWNWPAKNSFWYPGADIAFIDAEDIASHCGPGVGYVPRMTHIDEVHDYELDWEFLFRCLSDLELFDDPMPMAEMVPIIGVHWIVELYGNAAAWFVVSDMKMALDVNNGGDVSYVEPIPTLSIPALFLMVLLMLLVGGLVSKEGRNSFN